MQIDGCESTLPLPCNPAQLCHTDPTPEGLIWWLISLGPVDRTDKVKRIQLWQSAIVIGPVWFSIDSISEQRVVSSKYQLVEISILTPITSQCYVIGCHFRQFSRWIHSSSWRIDVDGVDDIPPASRFLHIFAFIDRNRHKRKRPSNEQRTWLFFRISGLLHMYDMHTGQLSIVNTPCI